MLLLIHMRKHTIQNDAEPPISATLFIPSFFLKNSRLLPRASYWVGLVFLGIVIISTAAIKNVFADDLTLAAHWNFDEQFGIHAYDDSGNTNTGTLHYGMLFLDDHPDTNINIGSIGIDGTGGVVSIPNSASLDFSNSSFTWSMWVKRNTTGRNQTFLSQGTGGVNENLVVGFEDNDKPVFSFWGNDLVASSPNAAYTDTENWHQYAGTYDVSTDARKLYVDGTLVAQDSSHSQHYQGVGDILLGNGTEGWAGNYFDGHMDDVRLYHGIMDDAQIAALHTQSMVAHWNFDTIDGGTTADDSSGFSNNGQIFGNVTASQIHAPTMLANSGSYNFDGTNDTYIDAGNDTSFDASDAYSISAWIKPESADNPDGTGIICKGTRGNYKSSWCLDIKNGHYHASIREGLAQETELESVAAVTTDWTHVVLTMSNSHMRLYINGTMDRDYGGASVYPTSDTVTIGCSANSGGSFTECLDGQLDDVRFYTSELSANTVTRLAQHDGPFAYWKFDETDGDIAIDNATNAYTGRLTPDGVGPAHSEDHAPISIVNPRSLHFDGSNYVDTQSTTILTDQNKLTVSAWVKVDTYGTQQAILSTYNDGAGFLLETGTVTNDVLIGINDGNNAFGYTDSNVYDDQWHLWTVVYDGTETGNTNRLKFFIDDTQITLGFNEEIPSSLSQSTKALTIGASVDDVEDRYFQGSIDDVRLYDYPLDASTIVTLAGETSGGGSSSSSSDSSSSSSAASLLGYWDLNSAPAIDRSGLSHDATGHGGGIVRSDSGAYFTLTNTGSYFFDGGVGSYLSVPDSTDFTINTITLSLWLKPDTTSEGGASLVCKGTGGGGEVWCIDVYGSTYRFFFYPSGGGGLAVQVIGTSSITTDWTQVTATYDGKIARLYVNGKEEAESAYEGLLDSNTHDISIGCRQSGGGDYDACYHGLIDDVKIYDGALSPAEVLKNTYQGLVGDWGLDEGAGTVAHDMTDNGNDGTVQNSPTWTATAAPTIYQNTGALVFGGSTQVVDAPMTGLPTGASPRSLGGWIYMTSRPADIAIPFAYGDCNTGGDVFGNYVASDGTLSFWGCAAQDYNTSAVVSLNAWHHIMETYDGDMVRMYLDGTELPHSVTALNTAVNRLVIGGDGPVHPENFPFTGTVDDVQVFDRELNSGEVAFLASDIPEESSSSSSSSEEMSSESSSAGWSGPPIEISSCEDFEGINFGDLTAHYVQTQDIDCSETDFSPVGNFMAPFEGTYDGSGHTISGAQFFDPGAASVGIFGAVGESGVVENVGSINTQFYGQYDVGGLVGTNYGTVRNSYASAYVLGQEGVGGLAGSNQENATIENSYAVGTVLAQGFVGGLVGFNDGLVRKSYANVIVTIGDFESQFGGGLIGLLDEEGRVEDSFAGLKQTINPDAIEVGQVIGLLTGGTLSNVYGMSGGNPSTCTGDGSASGCHLISSFSQLYHPTAPVYTDWDFTAGTGDWVTPENRFPLLRWQNPLAYWRLDTIVDGDTVPDASGNGHTAEIVNGVGTEQIAPLTDVSNHTSFSFNGTDQFLITDPAPYSGLTETTIMAWVRSTGVTGDFQTIVAPTDMSFVHLQLNAEGNIAVYVDGGTAINLPEIYPDTSGRWHHVAISVKSGDINTYLDGELMDHETDTYTTIDAPTNLHIGNGYGNARFFEGNIDDVRIYDHAVSVVEIRTFATKAPVGHWSFDELSGTTALDEENSDNDGTLLPDGSGPARTTSAAPTTFANSGSLVFDGADDYVDVGQDESLDTTDFFTLAAWVKPLTMTGSPDPIIIRTAEAAITTYSLYEQTDGTVCINVRDGDTNIGTCTLSTLDTSEWSHVTAVFDGLQFLVYFNGELQNSSVTATLGFHPPETEEISTQIGDSTIDSYWGQFHGFIDEPEIFDYALTPGQIKNLAGLEVDDAPPEVGDCTLGAYWALNEGSGSTAIDSSGNSLNGTLSGITLIPSYSADVPTVGFADPYSLAFTESGQLITIAKTISDTFTFSMWIKTDGIPHSYANLIGQQADSGLYYTDRNTLDYYNAAGEESIDEENETTLTTGVWHHIAVVSDAGDGTFYVDGVADGTFSGAVGTDLDRIGSDNSEEHFLGKMDDIRVYDSALTSEQIAELAGGSEEVTCDAGSSSSASSSSSSTPGNETWTGNHSTDWADNRNWDGGSIPDSTTNVIIPRTAHQPILFNDASIASLTLDEGARLTLNEHNLTFATTDSFVNNRGTLALYGNETLTNFTNDTSNAGTVLYYGSDEFDHLNGGSEYANLIINDGLVGYWPFDENPGDPVALDVSGYGADGVFNNGVTSTADAINPQLNFINRGGLLVNGTNQSVSVYSGSELPVGNQPYTISAWINPTTMGTEGIIGWGNYVSDDQSNVLRLSSTGIVNEWGNDELSVDTGDLSGGWNNVIATYDGTTRSLYLNGDLVASDTPSGTHAVPNAANMTIGMSNTGDYFGGSIDEVRVYNYAVSPSVISAIANGNEPGASRSSFQLQAETSVHDTFFLNAGALSTQGYRIILDGSWINNGGLFEGRSSTLLLNSSDSDGRILSGGQAFGSISTDGDAGTWTFQDNVTIDHDLSISTDDVIDTAGWTVILPKVERYGVFTTDSSRLIFNGTGALDLNLPNTFDGADIESTAEYGLIGYWKFDEGNGTSLKDVSHHGYNGLREGTGPLWTRYTPELNFNNPFGLRFNGTDDQVSTNMSLNDVSHFTVAGWISVDSENDHTSLFGQNDVVEFGINSPTSLACWTAGGGDVFWTFDPDSFFENFHHIACIGDGTNLKLYVDGEVVATDGTPTDNYGASAYPVTIGGGVWNGYGDFFSGIMDDVRIYNVALNDDDMQHLAHGNYAHANGEDSAVNYTLLNDALNGGTLRVIAGSLDVGSYDLSLQSLNVLGGDLTNGNSIDLANGAYLDGGAFYAPTSLTIHGGMTNLQDTFNANGGHVTFTGGATQHIYGSTTFQDLNLNGAYRIGFGSGDTLSVLGTLTADGSDGELISLFTTGATGTWNINLSNTPSLSYLDITGSLNIAGSSIDCLTGCIDEGLNVGWNFGDEGGGGSSSSESGPIEISTCDQLVGINEGDLSASYIQTQNIDCGSTEMSPIGTPVAPFTGIYEGSGFIIRRIYINSSISSPAVGLFGYVQTGALIRNLGIVSGTVISEDGAGGFVGVNKGTIENSFAWVNVSAGDNYAGGFVARNAGIIRDSYARGTVSGEGYYNGGFAGQTTGTSFIQNAYSYNSVTGADYNAGFVGLHGGGLIENVFAGGGVSGGSHLYALGFADGGTLSNGVWSHEILGDIPCFADDSDVEQSGCTDNGLFLTAFSDPTNEPVSHFADSGEWWTPGGLLPELRWQAPVSYYPFNQSGIDKGLAGNDLTGEPEESPPVYESVSGAPTNLLGNSGALVTGSPQYLKRETFNDLPTSQMTICSWIRTANPEMAYIVQQGRGGDEHDVNTEFGFEILPTGYVSFWDYDSGYGYGEGSIDNHTDEKVNNGQWHHVCFVKDGIHGAYYLDGAAHGTSTADKDVTNYSTNDFVVARDDADEARYFDGDMDDLRIYARALSAEEIGYLGGGGSSDFTPLPTSSSSSSSSSSSESSASSAAPLCGDGTVDDGEDCDDGNTHNGDGCSNLCAMETHWNCGTNPGTAGPSTCYQQCSFIEDAPFPSLNYKGNCDLYVPGDYLPTTWNNAQAACSGGLGGNLMSMIDANVNHRFEVLLRDTDYGWMGLRQNAGVFTWVAGDTLDYTNWAEDEPSGTDQCGVFLPDGTWADASCTIPLGFFCQIPLGPGCGNGAIDAGEECDDTNIANGDGCSASCTIESGYACSGDPSSCSLSESSSSISDTSAIVTGVVGGTTGGSRGHNTGTQPFTAAIIGARITEKFKAAAPKIPQTIFRDVPVNAWYAPYVTELLLRDAISGYKDAQGKDLNLFKPGNSVSYAELIKIAMIVSHKKTAASAQNVSAWGTWAAPYIAGAEALHVSTLSPTLDISTPMTRGAVLQTLLEIMNIPIKEDPLTFKDVSPYTPYAKAISTATALGIVNGDIGPDGKPKGTFRPNDPVTRAEAAKIIVKALISMRKKT